LPIAKKKIWENENKELKKKKKLEYTLFDVLQAGNAERDKLKKIRQICDERDLSVYVQQTISSHCKIFMCGLCTMKTIMRDN
jgi:hypothetical protein